MKNYTNKLVGLLTVVVLSASSNVFADSIRSVLDVNLDSDVSATQISNSEHNSVPRTLNEYVAQFQKQNDSSRNEPTINHQTFLTALERVKAGKI